MVRDDRNDNIVPPFEKQPGELRKLCRAIRKTMQEHEDVLSWIPMIEQLNHAFRADFRGRVGDQFPDVAYRLGVGRWLARRFVDEWPARNRQANDGEESAHTRYGSPYEQAPEGPFPLSVAHAPSRFNKRALDPPRARLPDKLVDLQLKTR